MSFSHFSMEFHNPNPNRSIPKLARYFGGLQQNFSTAGVPQPPFTLPHTSACISLRSSMSPRVVEVEGDMEGSFATASNDRISGPHDASPYNIGSSMEVTGSIMNGHVGGSSGVFGESGPRRFSEFERPVNTLRATVRNPLGNGSPYDPQSYRHPPSSIRFLLNADQQSDAPQEQAEGQDNFQSTSYSPSRTPPSTPGTSEFSGSTFRSDSLVSQATERYNIVVDVYYICVDASSKYIRSLRATSRHRRSRNHRHSPYRNHSSRESSSTSQSSIEDPNLMDNISVISNNLWREARRDIMARHRVEAEAVQDMCRLYAWGEMVVQARDSRGLYENDNESEGGSVVAVVGDTLRAAEAAKSFCLWMGDDAASRECVIALVRLRRLEGEQRGSVRGSFDGFQ